MNADLLTAVVYETVYHGYFYCLNYIDNQFIIAIRHLRGLWYNANIPRLRGVQALLRHTYEQSLAVVYWPYTTPPRAILLNYRTATFILPIMGLWCS
jgi:hypothetical protein